MISSKKLRKLKVMSELKKLKLNLNRLEVYS